jgi:uncharacterized protein YjbJ (UPF0337 family)
MNKDQVKGAAREAGGKLQRKVGAATGNGTQQLKGIATEVEGKAQKAFGDAREALKGKRTRPA